MGAKPRANQPATDREALHLLLAPTLAGTAGAARALGLATSEAADRLFACGYPHLAVVDPRHPGDRDPRGGALRQLRHEAKHGHWWPARVAAVVLRARLAAKYERGRPCDAAELIAGLSDRAMSEAEGARITRETFADNKSGAAHGRVSLLLVEAVIGARPVAEAMVDTLESLDDDLLNEFCNHRGLLLWELGFVLLRVAAPVAVELRRRLEAVFERARAIYPWEFEEPDGSTQGMIARRLDVVLHGAAGAARSGYRINAPGRPIDLSSTVFVDDDPDWVLAQLERWPVDDPDDYTPFWFRPMVLAGERGIALEAGRWRDYPAAERAAMASMLSDLASPAIARMFEEMAGEIDPQAGGRLR